MTTLKKLKKSLQEATTQSMKCPSCNHTQSHLEFDNKTDEDLPKTYRICDNKGCKEEGVRHDITGQSKTKFGVTY